jgi:GntR family transcriptional regulator
MSTRKEQQPGMASVGGSGELFLYSRLREIFREKVRSGEWPAEQPIPSERDLSGRYGVSRMTVRQAILELVDEGLFYREQGRGTFVGRHPIGEQPRLAGFTEEMHARDRKPATKLLEARMWPADRAVAERLRIKPGQFVVRLRRLRFVDGAPLVCTLSYISFLGCEALLQKDLESGSLYGLLETEFDLPPLEGEQTIEARVADDETAATLGIQLGEPVLVIRRITSTRRNRVLEYAISTYRGDRYSVGMHLDRQRMSSLTGAIDNGDAAEKGDS